jgi:hypothetical protein
VSKECIERQELLDKLEKTKDELLEMRKNACKNTLFFFKIALNRFGFLFLKIRRNKIRFHIKHQSPNQITRWLR